MEMYYKKNNTFNELKKFLTYTDAVWTCSDGQSFNNFEDAIFHQRVIRKVEEISC